MKSGIFESQDLLSAYWLHLRPRRSLLVVGIVLLASFFWAAWDSTFNSQPSAGWERWIMPGILVYFAFALVVLPHYQSRKTYRQLKDLHRQVAFSFSDFGLESHNDHGGGTKPWGDYRKWKEGKSLFLIYLTDSLYQVLPKRFFESETEISQFRTLLEQKLPKGRA